MPPNPEEVAEGVEDFQITYGQDTNGDNFADIFTPADAVADWRQVVSVRASLLLRSKADNTAQTTQPYNFNGATTIAPPDRGCGARSTSPSSCETAPYEPRPTTSIPSAAPHW